MSNNKNNSKNNNAKKNTNNKKNAQNKKTQEQLDKRKNIIIAIVCSCVAAVILLSLILGSVLSDKTNKMGKGACEYLDSRDTTGRDIKYVEMCVEDYGRLVILLDATTAPETVANFISLVESGFYDGLTFHRIITDFMIQGGDPKADGSGGNTDEDGNEINIKGEFSSNGHKNDISHKYGVISMARSNEPNSASSQFFICNADASDSLDGNYAAFGYVVEGMSVIDEITEDIFPLTDYADYYGSYEIDATYQTYKHYVWQYLGNGTLSKKVDQPVIKYIKVLDSWEK